MSDKIALVTGGGKRLGAKIACALAEDGWHVIIHYNSSGTQARAIEAVIREAGGSASTVQFDLADSAGVKRFADGLGRLDLLVNSASVFEQDRPETVEAAALEHALRVNLMAPVLLASAMAQPHESRASGCVINLLDQKLFNLNPDFFSYTLAKHALLSATTTMAMALAPRVRVNGIAPGLTLPSGGQSEAEFQRAHQTNPMQGGSTPDDIVRAVRFIVATPSMTGETLTIDGGEHLMRRIRDVSIEP
ncbi:SDR family oxidoreductase [Maricaulis salignorans]|uniref:NAD(P)-dependent dehydrogenase, short-chain alcohol dehydrogenase family n=1 Tax=Maricaulis salignorans TaxID=144026 RepID=A0A1G9MRM1_9PROT|nr:SDR family oxidoreductase [Maricaulis salignorans]SDL76661.1 NAD(P)-dependent dehydrogenase, short-chain alcohol dehydrogenase family [Maricaulis salignorans]